MPVVRDVLMMCVMVGLSVGAIAFRRVEGMGSRGQVVGWFERRSMDVSFLVRVKNEESDALIDRGSRYLHLVQRDVS